MAVTVGENGQGLIASAHFFCRFAPVRSEGENGQIWHKFVVYLPNLVLTKFCRAGILLLSEVSAGVTRRAR